MRLDFVRSELKKYIKERIKPLYKTFDKAHNLSHFRFVTENCVDYARELISKGERVDLEIAYLVGALHDIGISKGREGHAKSSAALVREDEYLNSILSKETIELIAEAVEDHSSHLEYEPRSIYGKIVADADRNNSMYLVFSRPTKFELKKSPNASKKEIVDRVYEFVNAKFGRSGYVKYWLDIEKTTKEQNKIWELLDDKNAARMYILGMVDEITKGKLK